MILLITVVTVRCYLIASESVSKRSRIIAAGMASWIGFQSYINIGVATGLLPNTGIPLPFVSYGLTSLLCLYFGLGLVQSIHLTNNLKTASEQTAN
jgi:rod shape determining protein RodA